ncbi:hypothetical protein MKX01_018503 [Papaver californicum]|nr:hypothetical protein MKX01_018503 [Papaver californicum]
MACHGSCYHNFVVLFVILTYVSSSTQQVSSKLVLEESYEIITILDGNKLNNTINPSSVLPRDDQLLILDTPNSAFYSVSVPISQDSKINRLSGTGVAGYSDGNLGSAMFDRPRSFAVDFKGNVYVADKNNHAIRKITREGVVTIAGGYSRKPGRADGPAQNASFSEDFELFFVPKLCALLIADRGSRLVRQLSLKPNDCTFDSQSKLGLVSASLIGVFCFILGLVIAFGYQYLVSRGLSSNHRCKVTWKPCLINLGRTVQIISSDVINAVVKSPLYMPIAKLGWLSISHLALMFQIHRLERNNFRTNNFSLLDSNCSNNHEVPKEGVMVDPLNDLINFDEAVDNGSKKAFKQSDEGQEPCCLSSGSRIYCMIESNVMEFDEQVRVKCHSDVSLMGSSSLIKRK